MITLYPLLENYDILYKALVNHDLKIVDFGELVKQNKNISKYVGALNWIERIYYETLFSEEETLYKMMKSMREEEIKKNKRVLKILGKILVLCDVVAYIIGGKVMIIISISVILVTYFTYIIYYPHIFIEIKTKQGAKQAYEWPFTVFAGVIMATLLSLTHAKFFNYDFGSYMKMTGFITLLLALLFVIKSSKTSVKQRFTRKLSVIFTVFIIAFTITFPVNFLLTFDVTSHEYVTVVDKRISSGKTRDRELYVNYNGEIKEYNVAKSEYERTSIGDEKRICLRKSALGLEYSTIHD